VSEEASGLAAVSSLEDPVRARLYDAVCRHAGPVSRDTAAAAAGIGRPLAAYHLDKLVDLGLLSAAFQRPEGRRGPGAGRPAKVYSRSGREFAVTVPPREYELAARLLAAAVEADSAGTSRAALNEAARQFGVGLAGDDSAAAGLAGDDSGAAGDDSRADLAGDDSAAAADDSGAGRAGDDSGPAAGKKPADKRPARKKPADNMPLDKKIVIESVLRRHGFEPWPGEDGSLRLRNCPFHGLARLHPELVCGMNRALIEGLAAGLGARDLRADLDPRPGQCCVRIGPHATSTTGRS
jgi:predicted ArsR family transcriptional regulator